MWDAVRCIAGGNGETAQGGGRMLNNPTYKPRWEKLGKAVVCCAHGCKECVIACSKVITKEKLTQLCEDAALECSSDTIPVPNFIATWLTYQLEQ